VADPLLSTTTHLDALCAWLAPLLPEGVTVWPDEPPSRGGTPFVVVTASLRPARITLDGGWSTATLRVTTWSVHDTKAQARALGDLVQTAFLHHQVPLPGVLDVEPDIDLGVDEIAGVAQAIGGWAIAMQKST
jgi:hypothetical protein